MLNDLKLLIPNANTEILNIYIRKSITLIKNYMNNPKFDNKYIEDNFGDAIIEIVVNAYTNKDNSNLKSITQGARSVSYSDNTAFCINNSVIALLPTPYLRMF